MDFLINNISIHSMSPEEMKECKEKILSNDQFLQIIAVDLIEAIIEWVLKNINQSPEFKDILFNIPNGCIQPIISWKEVVRLASDSKAMKEAKIKIEALESEVATGVRITRLE